MIMMTGILERVGEDKKGLCQLFGKLYIPDVIDDDKIRTLKLLIHNLRAVCLPRFLCVLRTVDCAILIIVTLTPTFTVF